MADCERLCLLQKSCAAATDGHRGLVVIQSGRTETGEAEGHGEDHPVVFMCSV